MGIEILILCKVTLYLLIPQYLNLSIVHSKLSHYLCTRSHKNTLFITFMRKFLLSLLMLVSFIIAKADNSISVVNLDGTVAEKYDIDQLQRIDLSNADSVRFVMSDGTSKAFAVNAVPKLAFAEITTDITAPETAITAEKLRVWADGSSLYISGAANGEPIAVFTISGVRIAQGKAGNDTTRIDTQSLVKGVYIVKAGKQAVKIIKK